jgi:DNA primase
MKVRDLFQKIIDDEKIIDVLEELEMHHISDKGNYITCGYPTGDNPKSVTVYKDNLWVNSYTRDIADDYGYTNIISLVSYIKDFYFTKSIKWICDICGYNYYESPKEKVGMLKFLDEVYSNKSVNKSDDEVEYLKPIDEYLLKYYGNYCNMLFKKDNIDFQTQTDFELGYDLKTHSVTIPIRDELSTLVGVKARLYKEKNDIKPWDNKYFYIVPCAKSKVLYGLHKTMPYIKRVKSVYVVESEKAVMQLWSQGIRNVVAIGCKKPSRTQVKKIVQLGVNDIILCFDEDVGRQEDGSINMAEYTKVSSMFLPCQNVYGMIDLKGNILDKKESPTDNMEKFLKLDSTKILIESETVY